MIISPAWIASVSATEVRPPTNSKTSMSAHMTNNATTESGSMPKMELKEDLIAVHCPARKISDGKTCKINPAYLFA